MNNVVEKQYTEEQKKMLKKPIPAHPCQSCSFHRKRICQECQALTSYTETVQPYKDAGIYEEAFKIRQMMKMEEQVLQIREKHAKLNEELPSFVRRDPIVIW